MQNRRFISFSIDDRAIYTFFLIHLHRWNKLSLSFSAIYYNSKIDHDPSQLERNGRERLASFFCVLYFCLEEGEIFQLGNTTAKKWIIGLFLFIS